MASITLYGVPLKNPLLFKLKRFIIHHKKGVFSFKTFIPFLRQMLKIIILHDSYCKEYDTKILTLRNELTKLDIPKEIRTFLQDKIFVHFSNDIAEEIAYDSKYIKIVIDDILLNVTFALEEQTAMSEKVKKICLSYFPEVDIAVIIKGIDQNRGHSATR